MSVLILETDVSGEVPFPALTLRNVVRRRGDVLMGGAPIASWLPSSAYVEVSDGSDSPPGLPDFMRGVGFAVTSHRLKRVFEEAQAEVEFVSIPLRYHGTPHPGFFLANSLRRVRAVDLAKSSIELNEVGIALTARSLVLDESALAGLPVAFVHEIVKVVVQPQVAAAVLSSGCVGCAFIDAEGYRF